MKKLKLLMALMMMSCAAFSQDTSKIWVPRQDLRAALVRLEQCRVDSAELIILKGQNTALMDRLNHADQSIRTLENSVRNRNAQIENWKTQDTVRTEQIRLMDQSIQSLNKALKRQKVKTITVGVLAFLAIGGLLFSL